MTSPEEVSLRTSVTVVVGRESGPAGPGFDAALSLVCGAELPLASRLLNPPVEGALLGERVDAEPEEASMALSRFIWSSMDVGGDTWKRRET